MAYERRYNFKNADAAYNGMAGAAPALGIKVSEPEWLEMEREDDVDYFNDYLVNYIKKFGEPQIVVIVLSNERIYGKYKAICYKHDIISQVIQARTA
jgi:hypothetical protein